MEKGKATKRRPARRQKKGGGGLLLILLAGAAALALSKKDTSGGGGGGGTGTGAPIVDVGADKQVVLDQAGHASVVVNYTVNAPNPVTLAWTGATPGAPGQATADYTAPGSYTIRLTATDTVTGKVGADELVVTVLPAPVVTVTLIAGRLVLQGDKTSDFAAIRLAGEPVAVSWPCQNLGDGQGQAWVTISEGALDLWQGAAMPVFAGTTVNLTASGGTTLPAGVHNLVARMQSPGGVVGSQPLVIEVVDPAVLATVGSPIINGLVGPLVVNVVGGNPVTVQWSVQNTGGDAGSCRLRSKVDPFSYIWGVIPSDGALTEIPGDGVRNLVIGISTAPWQYNYVHTFTIDIWVEEVSGRVVNSYAFVLQLTP